MKNRLGYRLPYLEAKNRTGPDLKTLAMGATMGASTMNALAMGMSTSRLMLLVVRVLACPHQAVLPFRHNCH